MDPFTIFIFLLVAIPFIYGGFELWQKAQETEVKRLQAENERLQLQNTQHQQHIQEMEAEAHQLEVKLQQDWDNKFKFKEVKE
jgi:hypothetical protein